VAEALRRHATLHRALVEPLTVAALNTPAEEASTRMLGAVLRRLGAPGAARLYVAERGLGPDLVAPALATLGCHMATARFGQRLRALALRDRVVEALDFGEERVALAPGDAVVLALPPWEAARLIPACRCPPRTPPS
jgi:predicted NAD/FAD-binding protein